MKHNIAYHSLYRNLSSTHSPDRTLLYQRSFRSASGFMDGRSSLSYFSPSATATSPATALLSALGYLFFLCLSWLPPPAFVAAAGSVATETADSWFSRSGSAAGLPVASRRFSYSGWGACWASASASRGDSAVVVCWVITSLTSRSSGRKT